MLITPVPAAFADDTLDRYEGDIHLPDESTGWVIGNPCEDPRSESVDNGHFVLEWIASESVNYTYIISNDAGELPSHPRSGANGASDPTSRSEEYSIPATELL